MNAGIRNDGKAPGKLKKRLGKRWLPELGTRARMLEVAEFHETAQFNAQAARAHFWRKGGTGRFDPYERCGRFSGARY